MGACVGFKGSRVKAIVDELNGEKLDVVIWSKNIAEFIANSLSPSKVLKVDIDEKEKSATVVVPDYQLSLAIGKEGQNARLAAKLTNWKIDIKSETQYAEEKAALEERAEDSVDDTLIEDLDETINDSIEEVLDKSIDKELYQEINEGDEYEEKEEDSY